MEMKNYIKYTQNGAINRKALMEQLRLELEQRLCLLLMLAEKKKVDFIAPSVIYEKVYKINLAKRPELTQLLSAIHKEREHTPRSAFILVRNLIYALLER